MPSNFKAERLLAYLTEDVCSLHLPCRAHRAHSIGNRVWDLAPKTLSQVIHVLLCLRTAANMLKLELAMMKLVEKRLVVLFRPHMLSAEARSFRRKHLALFMPPDKYPRRRTMCLAFASILNGNWQKKNTLIHICSSGCCGDREAAVNKVQWALKRVLKTMKPNRVCQGNWQEWHRPMAFIGLLGAVHGILQDSFADAFSKDDPEEASRESDSAK